MEEFLESVKSETKDLFRSKKNLANLLILGILILALPLSVGSLRYQQIIKSRAEADPIVFTGPNVEQRNGKWVALKPQISLEITSPLGPPAPSSTPSPTSTPTPSGSPSPSPSGSPSPSPSTKTRVYIDPAVANSGSKVVMIATAPMGCETNINFDPGAGLTACSQSFEVITCSRSNPKDSNQCWWQKTCTAGAVGTYTASFNASGTGCASSATYTIK